MNLMVVSRSFPFRLGLFGLEPRPQKGACIDCERKGCSSFPRITACVQHESQAEVLENLSTKQLSVQ